MSINIFFSYAHEDIGYLNKLQQHLTFLQQEGLVSTFWYDREIGAGAEREKEIDARLQSAHIILLLVSPDFIASKYCNSKEVHQAMERHRKGDAKVIPIILRPVYWQGTPFSKLQALPQNARPITDRSWRTQDFAYYNVAEGIRTAIHELTLQGSTNGVVSPERILEPQKKNLTTGTKKEETRLITTRAEKPSENARKLRISRRMLISSLTGGAIVVAAGGLTSWALAHRPSVQHPSPRATSTAPVDRPTLTQTPTSTLTTSAPLFTYRGHSNNVESVAWSPDGSYIASIAFDDSVQVWNPHTDTTLSIPQFEGYLSGAGQSVAWSPSGKYIATADDSNFVSIWDWQAKNNNRIALMNTSHPLRCISWSPDGQYLAIAKIDKVAQVFDVSNVTIPRSFKIYGGHKGAVNGVTWSPTSTYFATASKDTTVRVWKAVNGDLLGTYSGHKGEVYSVAWSPDSIRIASASCDATVQVWNAFTQKTLFLAHFPGKLTCVRAVAWSPDGKYLVACSWNGTVAIWNLSQTEPLLTYTGHTKPVSGVAWSPKGNYIATGSDDHTVQVWQFS